MVDCEFEIRVTVMSNFCPAVTWLKEETDMVNGDELLGL